jgi:hypothetical protein
MRDDDLYDLDNSCAELGHMYTYNYVARKWSAHRITKLTKRRIFVLTEGGRQCSFDSAKVEARGDARSGRGANARRFYSEAGKAAEEAKWARIAAEIRCVADLLEHDDLLGLGAEFTRDDVRTAFRQQAQKHHPDKGGDTTIFRRLVEARDRALASSR